MRRPRCALPECLDQRARPQGSEHRFLTSFWLSFVSVFGLFSARLNSNTPDARGVSSGPASLGTSASQPSTPLPPPSIPDHELLRRIGRGSYGEVWLARSVMGTLRAVKILHRSSFDRERPYERAYAGLQQFEPVSRPHQGVVDILQI